MSVPASSRPDPVSPLVQRLVASAGLAFAVLLVITVAITSAETPDDGAPLAEWTEFARDNEDNFRIGALVFALATYNFLLFLGYLRSVIGEAEARVRGFTRAGHIVLAAGAVGIGGMALALLVAAYTIADPQTPPEILRSTYDLTAAASGVASAAMGACLVTVGLVNAGVRALPSWLGGIAIAGGLSFVLQLGILLAEDEDNVFGVFFPIGVGLLAIFCAGASVSFLRAAGSRPLP
ncbi:MAG TPA: hypothetical protein VF529_19500 [Solirubrobacteraceae bacterium]|jgi:hypothetical protein